MNREVTHHMESVIAGVRDMFDQQAQAREIDRETWFLVRDHTRAAEGELQLIRDHVDALEERNRVLEEQNTKAQALIVTVSGAARNLRSSLDSGIAAVKEVGDELDVEKEPYEDSDG